MKFVHPTDGGYRPATIEDQMEVNELIGLLVSEGFVDRPEHDIELYLNDQVHSLEGTEILAEQGAKMGDNIRVIRGGLLAELLALKRMADRYENINRNGGDHNSYENMSLYVSWFSESLELFSRSFERSNPTFKAFTEFNIKGNGSLLLSKFSRTHPLFKILVRQLETQLTRTSNQNMASTPKDRIFVVHGHADKAKLEVARLIENDLGKRAIILHEQVNMGREILGKFEENSDVDLAVAIWSRDDEGRSLSEKNFNPRARQNVIFETGYFIGKLGRSKVIVLLEDGIEAPSDYQGLVYISMRSDWKYQLSKEIRAIYES